MKIGSGNGGGKSCNLDVVTCVKQPSAARAHDAGHQYPLAVGRHARPRPESVIALRIRVLQGEPMDKFDTSSPRSAPRWESYRAVQTHCLAHKIDTLAGGSEAA